MSDVVDLEDHIAYACLCGSVKFNLLKSGKIECCGCGGVFSYTFYKNPNEKETLEIKSPLGNPVNSGVECGD